MTQNTEPQTTDNAQPTSEQPRLIRSASPQSVWTLNNFQAILERLAPIHEQIDGTLYAEQHGPNMIVVTKTFNHLRLWIIDPEETDSGVVQSEISLDNPLYLVDPYTQAAILGLAWVPKPQRIYCAGLGAGRVPMVLHHYLPHVTIDCTEIDPVVSEMATRFFGFAEDERMRVHITDGRNWLAESEPYDYILIDVFLDRGYIPYRMSTVEFFTLCKQQLTPGGILVVNLLTEDDLLARRIASVRAAFGDEAGAVMVCPLSEGNTVLFAVNQTANTRRPDREELIQRAIAIQSEKHFSFPLATLSLNLTVDVENMAVDWTTTQPLYDAAPPASYFDLLPSLDKESLPTPIDPTLPCPCGSGRVYGACHGSTER